MYCIESEFHGLLEGIVIPAKLDLTIVGQNSLSKNVYYVVRSP